MRSDNEIYRALSLLCQCIGVYGERRDNPVSISFENGIVLRVNGEFVASGLVGVTSWIENQRLLRKAEELSQ